MPMIHIVFNTLKILCSSFLIVYFCVLQYQSILQCPDYSTNYIDTSTTFVILLHLTQPTLTVTDLKGSY